MDRLLEVYEEEARGVLAPEALLELVADGFIFTEGPVWDFARGHLVFSDIPADTMYRYRPGRGVSVHRKPSNFSNGMTIDRAGRLVVCEHRTRRVAQETGPGVFATVVDSYQGKRLNAPNDVVVASDGSIVFTDPHYGLGEGFGGPAEQELSHRGVYRLPPDGSGIQLLAADFDGPNGLALAPSGDRLYVDDTEGGHIRSFRIDEGWRLSGGEVLAELRGDGEGVLDGLKVDEDGALYCTGPGGIFVVHPSGAVLARIRVPEVAANLAWGDADAMSLYMTASNKLYRLRTQVRGFAPHRDTAAESER